MSSDMNRLMLRALLACALSVTSAATLAQYTGAQFQRDIVSADRERQVAAAYFVGGVVDQTQLIANVLQLTGSGAYDKSLFFCIPSSAKLGDVIAIVKSRMSNPSIALSESAATHVTRAVRDVWPCR
jgi:hypothetical protein